MTLVALCIPWKKEKRIQVCVLENVNACSLQTYSWDPRYNMHLPRVLKRKSASSVFLGELARPSGLLYTDEHDLHSNPMTQALLLMSFTDEDVNPGKSHILARPPGLLSLRLRPSQSPEPPSSPAYLVAWTQWLEEPVLHRHQGGVWAAGSGQGQLSWCWDTGSPLPVPVPS